MKQGSEIVWARNYARCVECGSTEFRHKSKGYCKKCYPTHKHEIMLEEICSKCGRKLKGYRDRKAGAFICLSCRSCRVKRCYLCGQEKVAHLRIGNGVYVCENCSKLVKDGKCTYCGNQRQVLLKNSDSAICYACDSRPASVCSICHTVVKFYKTDENGTVLCKKCYTPAPKKCILCEKIRTPHKKTSRGHVCEECYEKPMRQCAQCGVHRVGYKKIGDKYLCRECYYTSLLKQAIKDIKGTFSAAWAERLFLEYLKDKNRVQSSEIVWRAVLRDKPLFDMLGCDFTDRTEITTDLFWKHYHGMNRKRIGQLYAFLVDRGYIARAELPSEDIQRHHRIFEQIELLPTGFQVVAHKYYDRGLKIRAKKLDAGWKDTDHGTGSYATYEKMISILADFVSDLQENRVNTFTEIAVHNVDDYIARHHSYARTIMRFMGWLYQEQYITWKYRGKWRDLNYSTPSPIHEEKYRYLIDKFLDEAYPVKESLICLLALVYGIRPKILRKLRIYDLKEVGNTITLRLPYFDVILHDMIADKMRRYLQESFFPNPFDIDNSYLFYGYTYQEPMDDGSIRNIFHKHGIKANQVLPTVIHRLFTEKIRHPAIISKVTGVHKATAVRYYDAYNPSVLEEINLNRTLYGKIK